MRFQIDLSFKNKMIDDALTFNVNSRRSLAQSLGDPQGMPGVDRSVNKYDVCDINVICSVNWICSASGVAQKNVIKLRPENVWTLLYEKLCREIVSKHLRSVGWRLEEAKLRASLVSPLPSYSTTKQWRWIRKTKFNLPPSACLLAQLVFVISWIIVSYL